MVSWHAARGASTVQADNDELMAEGTIGDEVEDQDDADATVDDDFEEVDDRALTCKISEFFPQVQYNTAARGTRHAPSEMPRAARTHAHTRACAKASPRQGGVRHSQ